MQDVNKYLKNADFIIREEGNHDNNVGFALQLLKKFIKRNEILINLKNREFYMSPSEKRRFKKNQAQKQKRREFRKQEWYDKNKIKQK